MEIHVREILKIKRSLTEIYVQHNSRGRLYDEIAQDMERDLFMTAQQSVDYGLADQVISQRN
jgi:ATP-dependent Clp protease protease subunit